MAPWIDQSTSWTAWGHTKAVDEWRSVHSRLSELLLFDSLYITSYCLILLGFGGSTTFAVYVTASECLRSPSVLTIQLKLQANEATFTFWFMHKQVVVNTCYISRVICIKMVSNNKYHPLAHTGSSLTFFLSIVNYYGHY